MLGIFVLDSIEQRSQLEKQESGPESLQARANLLPFGRSTWQTFCFVLPVLIQHLLLDLIGEAMLSDDIESGSYDRSIWLTSSSAASFVLLA